MKHPKRMNRILVWALTAFTLAGVAGCYNDKDVLRWLTGQEQQLAALEDACTRINTNISSLHTIIGALHENDKISSIAPLMSEVRVIGYTISFTQRGDVTIYYGKDGQDGKNGQDAKAPVIGIMKEEDVWYWTLNGEWILDQEGNKVRADGVSPMLKIEEEKWWVSYDSGATWEQLGAIDGSQGGDSMFREVKQDERFWYFILADGEEIKIAKGGLTWVYV